MKPIKINIKTISAEATKDTIKMAEHLFRKNPYDQPLCSYTINKSVIEQLSNRSKMAREIEKSKVALIDMNVSKITSRKRGHMTVHAVNSDYTFYFKSRKGRYGKYTLSITVNGNFDSESWFIISAGICNRIANDIVNRPMFQNLTNMRLSIPLNLKYTHDQSHSFTTYDISMENSMYDFFSNYKKEDDIGITLLEPFKYEE